MPVQYDPGGQFARGFQNIAVIKEEWRKRQAAKEDKREKAAIGQSLANIAAARSGTLRKPGMGTSIESPITPESDNAPAYGMNVPKAMPLSQQETVQTISESEQDIAKRDPSFFLKYDRSNVAGRKTSGSRRIVTDKKNQMWSVGTLPGDKFKIGIEGKSRTPDNTEKIRKEAYKGVSNNLGISEYGMMNDPEMDILARDLIDQEIEAGTSPGQIPQNVVREINRQLSEQEAPPKEPGFFESIGLKAKSTAQALSEFLKPGESQAENPPVPGAEKAEDGFWYIKKGEQYFKVE